MCILQAVPLQFLHALLAYLGDTVSYDSASSGLKSPLASCPSTFYPGIDIPSEGLVRWQLRLEYFAYETLQDLRIAKLFEIIVDYPDRYVLFLTWGSLAFQLLKSTMIFNWLRRGNSVAFTSCIVAYHDHFLSFWGFAALLRLKI